MNMSKIKLVDLQRFCEEALVKSGVSVENAQIVTDVLVTTDTFGVMTHGTKNLGQYIQKMKAGGLDAKAEPSVVCEGPSFAIVNGNKAVGMVSGYKAMKLAIKKAKETKGQPTVIVCSTIKGKGVSFMENEAGWHGTAPNKEQCDQALKEIGGEN